MPLFTLDQVRYKHVLTIDHLDLEANQLTSIVGKSGSGKSTLLRLLNRMISPDEGTIHFNDGPIEAINPVELRRRVVMLPQNPVIFDGTVRDNVLTGLTFSERPPVADDEITRLLARMEIGRDLDSSAASLSGGERQRVAIARVLAMKTHVLLLDEPTSALDSGTQDAVIEHVITESRHCNTTIIMVTHATAIAKRWSDRIIEIEAGKVMSSGMSPSHG